MSGVLLSLPYPLTAGLYHPMGRRGKGCSRGMVKRVRHLTSKIAFVTSPFYITFGPVRCQVSGNEVRGKESKGYAQG